MTTIPWWKTTSIPWWRTHRVSSTKSSTPMTTTTQTTTVETTTQTTRRPRPTTTEATTITTEGTTRPTTTTTEAPRTTLTTTTEATTMTTRVFITTATVPDNWRSTEVVFKGSKEQANPEFSMDQSPETTEATTPSWTEPPLDSEEESMMHRESQTPRPEAPAPPFWTGKVEAARKSQEEQEDEEPKFVTTRPIHIISLDGKTIFQFFSIHKILNERKLSHINGRL
ncbi:unnamed protein product [Strongylus vulgaris]|uniref:Uncharacterized protein n=1 Tax=Strongylus vulgaris TaxID=40348 RepID=A0A3P7J4Z4_STRVU|nr:unnamed protein product [Strongylus vulgaris]